MRSPSKLLPGFLFFAFFIFAADARAEHVVLTSGGVSYGNPIREIRPGFGFFFAGQGLSAGGSGEKLGGPFTMSCYPCDPGQTLRTGAVITQFTSGYPGSATYNGTSYTNVTYQGSQFNLIVEPVVIPFDAPNTIELTSAFTFEGILTGYVFPNTSPIFSMTLSGQGIATLTLTRRLLAGGLLGGYDLIRTTYNFQPAAVPEPATLILLGTGLAGACANMRRRRRLKASARGTGTADTL